MSALRYSTDDLEGALLDGAWQQAERELAGRGGEDAISYGELVLDPNAEPPWHKMDLLRELEPKFDGAWRRKVSKKTEGWSPSEYDLSLATFAAQVGWTRQEIANLIIAARRKHGDDLKLRQDYYTLTINRAIKDHVDQEALAQISSAADEIVAARTVAKATGVTPPEVDRADLLRRISAGLGVEITRITRTSGESAMYSLETTVGSGLLGPVSAILNQNRFREKLADVTAVLPKRRKALAWDPLCRLIMEAAEVVESGVETTLRGRMETLLSVYLGVREPKRWDRLTETDRAKLAVELAPYRGTDGRVRVFTSGFQAWLGEVRHETWTAQQIAVAMRAYGAEKDDSHFTIGAKRTMRAIWALPL